MNKIRGVLESYKKKIHGSEYDYHCKMATLEEHDLYMDKVKSQALQSIRTIILECISTKDELMNLFSALALKDKQEVIEEVSRIGLVDKNGNIPDAWNSSDVGFFNVEEFLEIVIIQLKEKLEEALG